MDLRSTGGCAPPPERDTSNPKRRVNRNLKKNGKKLNKNICKSVLTYAACDAFLMAGRVLNLF
jgi:hypothetical protein